MKSDPFKGESNSFVYTFVKTNESPSLSVMVSLSPETEYVETCVSPSIVMLNWFRTYTLIRRALLERGAGGVLLTGSYSLFKALKLC